MGRLDRCRSSIASAARDFAVLDRQMEYRHWNFIKSTPFKYILLAMHRGDFKLNASKGCREGLEQLIRVYDPTGNTFHFGSVCRKVRKSDIALILGLPMEPNNDFPQQVSPTVFEKYFSGKSTVKKQDIIGCLDSLVKEEDEDKVRDFVVLLIILLCVSFLFQSSSGTISKAKIDLVDEKLYSNVWPCTICLALRESIQGVQTFTNLGGPTILLLYWFAEQVNLIRRIAKLQHHRPRAVRWDLAKVIKKLRSVDLTTLTPRDFSGYNRGEKVEEGLSFIGEKEKKFLKGGNIYTEDDDDDPDNAEFIKLLETLKAEEVEEEESEVEKKGKRRKKQKKQKKQKQVENKKKEAASLLDSQEKGGNIHTEDDDDLNIVLETEEVEEEENEVEKKVKRGKKQKKVKRGKNKKKEAAGTILNEEVEKENEEVEKENEEKKRNKRVRFMIPSIVVDWKEYEENEGKRVHFLLPTIDVAGKVNEKKAQTEEEKKKLEQIDDRLDPLRNKLSAILR